MHEESSAPHRFGVAQSAADHAGYDPAAIVLIKVENNHWKLVK